MAMVANDPVAAKRVGIPQSVGKDFVSADKGKKFAGGGKMDMKKMFRGMETPAEEMKEATALKSGKITPKQYVAGEKKEGHGKGAAKKAVAIKSGKLSPAAYASHEKTEKMKKGGCATKKMAAGGGVEAKGKTKGKVVKMAKGGGIESKGKTRGKVC